MKRVVFVIALLGISTSIAQGAMAKEKFLIQPVQVGNETVRYNQGVATVELFNRQGSVQIQPMPVDHGSLAFFVGVYNAGQLPANIDITNFSIDASGQPLAVFSRQDLEKKAKNRAMWTQIGIAALGGLAAAGAASQRDTYHSSFYTPRGSYHGFYSAPSAYGQIQAAAITAGTGYAIYNVQQRLDQTRRELADSVVQLSTIDPDRSYGGKIVLAKIKDKALPKIVTINLDWNGERYPFSFRLVKPGTPAPIYTNLAPVAQELPVDGVSDSAGSAGAVVETGLATSAAGTSAPIQISPVDLDAELASAARTMKTPMAFMEKTTVSKVRADGNSLVMTALVDQKGATVTENGRRQIIRRICETNPTLLKAGAAVRIDLFEGVNTRGPAFDTVAATRKDCSI
ncbi:MAG: hypothetical protein Q7T60_14915 [Sphingopyxis sp.]|nr:hypothetical protein [Sphingopyxis sp.]